jgi:hypothetical protein
MLERRNEKKHKLRNFDVLILNIPGPDRFIGFNELFFLFQKKTHIDSDKLSHSTRAGL